MVASSTGLAVDRGRQVEQHEVAVARRDARRRVRVPKRARRLSSSSVTAASSTSTSSTVTAMPSMSGSVISGRTSTSAVKARWSPSAISVTSMSGRPIGLTSSAAGDGLGVLGGDRRVHDLVEHDAPAQARLEDPGGRLARPEAGDADLLGDLPVRPVEVGLELVERHLDVDADARRTEALDGALHGDTPRNWCSAAAARLPAARRRPGADDGAELQRESRPRPGAESGRRARCAPSAGARCAGPRARSRRTARPRERGGRGSRSGAGRSTRRRAAPVRAASP